MVPHPALLLAQPDEAFAGPDSQRVAQEAELTALENDLHRLGVALGALDLEAGARELRELQQLTHEVMARAERSGVAEATAALFQLEDALSTLSDGELAPNADTRRHIDLAFGAARSACTLRLSELAKAEAAGLLGNLLLVVKEPGLLLEITHAATRRKFLATSAQSAEEARDIAGAATFSGVIMDFDGMPLAESEALARLLRTLPGTRNCPLIVVAGSPNFGLRLTAARCRAALLLPKPIAGDKLVAALQGLDVRDAPEHPRLLLLTCDDIEARRLDQVLKPLGMTVSAFRESEQIVEALDATQPAALIVDRQGERAEDVCRIVRAIPRWRDLPILLRVTAESARLAAYEAGADDALPDAGADRELVARLRVRLERTRVFREQSNRDPLTGLLTRRALTESMLARLAEARRAKRHLSVCFLDLDRFKTINDSYGHAVGDKVLASFGTLLGSRFRLPDLRGRWGGEEFLVAFYGEWAESAREILSRVTAEFAQMTFEAGAGKSFQVTVSGGIATYPVDGETLDDLILVADRRLYAAKRAGRNRIRI